MDQYNYHINTINTIKKAKIIWESTCATSGP